MWAAQELEAGQEALCVADHLHAAFLVLLEHAPFAIVSWSDWHAALQALPDRQRAVAERVGVTQRCARTTLNPKGPENPKNGAQCDALCA